MKREKIEKKEANRVIFFCTFSFESDRVGKATYSDRE